MTLIITELSSFGIVMVGDTAETVDCLNPNRTMGERAFAGLIKVLPVSKLNAGLSYWGWARMPPDDDNGIWLDWWLQDLVNRRRNDYNTLRGLARMLEQELREVVPPLTDNELGVMPLGSGGIHLAGFTKTNRGRVPCFWHIHNGRSQMLPNRRIDPHVVNANNDCSPQRFLGMRQGEVFMVRNGDIEAYVRLFERHLVDYFAELRRDLGIVTPLPFLITRAEFWSAQIQFISALYEASGLIENGNIRQMIKGIGDQVTTLTIGQSGIVSYFTR